MWMWWAWPGRRGPLPEVPPESYAPDSVPLPVDRSDDAWIIGTCLLLLADLVMLAVLILGPLSPL